MENQKQFYVFSDGAMIPVNQARLVDPREEEFLVQILFYAGERDCNATKKYALSGNRFDNESAYQAIFTVIRWMLASGCPFIPVDRICSDVIGRRLDIMEEGSIDAFAKQVYEELLVQV